MHIAVRHTLQIYDPADASLCEADAIVLPIAEAQAAMSETVAAYLARVAWRFELPTVCRINGVYYGRAEWPSTALALNDNVEFVSRPLGGGSGGSTVKTIASVVALIALTAVAGPAGSAIAGTIATAGSAAFAITSALATAVIVGAGSLAISHFLAPKSGGKTSASDELYSFGLAGNASRPMQPIPVLNGRLRFAPDFAAPTYSEYSGDTMTDYALYALTCKRMRVEQVLIGDTPIWHYQTGYNPDYPGITLQYVEPGDQVTLYPVNVVTADELGGAELSQAYTPGYIVNAAGTLTRQLLVDFVWAGGAYVTYKDRTLAALTNIEIQARPVDAAGAPLAGFTTVFTRLYSQAKQSQIRVTEHIAVPAGRYEVRGRRLNVPVQEDASAKTGGTDAVTWTALRAHIDGPQAFPRVSVLAVKGVASKQLSGVSSGQLRVIGTRILPVWTGSAFVDQPTRSIAWAALDWWRDSDYGGGRPLSDVDFQAFVAYDALWTSLGHTFDCRFTEVMNLDEVLETVLKAGRAFPAPVGDKLTLMRDEPRGLSRMLFTENDILKDSLEIDYALSDETWADGMVGEYLDETTWRLAEVSSAPDGVTLLKPARVQLQGVVNRKQATGMIRFMAAESQSRRISVNWTSRMEGRLLRRGALVKLSAEEPETWGQSAEVVAVASDGRSLVLDPPPVWTAGANHYVEIRQRDGRPWGPVLVARGADDAVAVVDAASAAGVAQAQSVTLANALARSDRQERPWLAFSPGQPRTFPVLITGGDPDQDGEHIHLSGVIDAPEVYAVDEAGVMPLPTVPNLYSSSLPAIIGLSASISQQHLVLTLTAGWRPALNAVSYVAEVTYDGGAQWIGAYRGDLTTFAARVAGSNAMKVRVAGITPSGQQGAWYVVAVAAPSLVVPGELVDISSLAPIPYEKIDANFQQRITGIQDQAAAAALAAQNALTTANGRLDSLRRSLAADPAIRRGYVDGIVGDIRHEVAVLADATTRNFSQLAMLQDTMAAAGIEVVAAEGIVRIAAISKLETTVGTQITNLSVTLDALKGQIDLYGSVQAGDLQGVISSITTVQQRLDALAGTVTTLATAAQFTDLSTRLSSAQQTIDGQAAAIASKASLTTVTAQGTRISQAETRLDSAEGRIFNVVTAAGSSAADARMLPRLLSQLGDLLGSQIGAIQQNIARAETSLSANFDEAGRAVAEVSTRLLVFKGEASAQFATVTRAIADTSSALVQATTSYDAQFAGVTASLVQEMQVRAAADSATTSNLSGALSRIGVAEAGLTSLGQTVATNASSTATQFQGVSARFATNEANLSSVITAYTTADQALGQRIDTVTARIGNAEGLIASETQARVSAEGVLTSQYNGLVSRVGGVEAGVSSVSQAQASTNQALANVNFDLVTRSNAGTAYGRFGMNVASAPAGVSVRIAAVASTESYGQQRNAGWYLDLLPDGTSRFVIDANFFALTANGGITYPFTFDGTTLTIPSLRVTQSLILPDAVNAKYSQVVQDIDPGAGSDSWREIPGTAVVFTPDTQWSAIFSGYGTVSTGVNGSNNYQNNVSLQVVLGLDGAPFRNATTAAVVASSAFAGGGLPNNVVDTKTNESSAKLVFFDAGIQRRISLLYKFNGNALYSGKINFAQLNLVLSKR